MSNYHVIAVAVSTQLLFSVINIKSLLFYAYTYTWLLTQCNRNGTTLLPIAINSI